MSRYDDNLIVIGAGSAGLIAALIAATVKARVTLIERDRMGGDCLNTGCVPSKTLIHSARVAHTVADAGRFGVRAAPAEVDFPAVMKRVHGAIGTIAPHDSVARYESLGVRCIAGEARLTDAHTVAVDGRTRSARSIVLATGARPVLPPIPGLGEIAPLTSENLWDLQSLPRRLLVLGAGPIGCELAQAFARLGSRVTLLDMEQRILPREDPAVSELMAARLAAEGVEVRAAHRAVRFEPGDDPALVAAHDDGEVRLAFDRVLVAVGRKAETAGLGLEELGIGLRGDGTIAVDAYLRTAVANVLACGDCTGPYQFTHMASHQAWYAAVNALFGRFRQFKANYGVVPWTTFTDPEVARVGLTEAEAAARGIDCETTLFELGAVDRAVTESAGEGFIQVVTAKGRDRILGATVVAGHAGELIGEYVTAMTHGLGLKQIMGTIHVYPTYSELNKHAASAWRRMHAPTWAFPWLERLHRWLR